MHVLISPEVRKNGAALLYREKVAVVVEDRFVGFSFQGSQYELAAVVVAGRTSTEMLLTFGIYRLEDQKILAPVPASAEHEAIPMEAMLSHSGHDLDDIYFLNLTVKVAAAVDRLFSEAPSTAMH